MLRRDLNNLWGLQVLVSSLDFSETWKTLVIFKTFALAIDIFKLYCLVKVTSVLRHPLEIGRVNLQILDPTPKLYWGTILSNQASQVWLTVRDASTQLSTSWILRYLLHSLFILLYEINLWNCCRHLLLLSSSCSSDWHEWWGMMVSIVDIHI